MGKFTSTTTSWGYPSTFYPEPVILLDVPLLIGICQNQGRSGKEQEIITYLDSLIREMPEVTLQYDSKENMYITKGVADVYPCMVAHLDTVHDYQQNYGVAVSADGEVLYAYSVGQQNTNLSRLSPPVRQAGVGGDDRCGIAIAIQLLKELPYFKVAFFREEEIGGSNGSGSAYMPFFEDTSLVLQCDRNGSSDWVQTASGTKVSSDEFIAAITPLLTHHGYKPIQSGGFTDVANLKKRKLAVCAANMSCGYYQPHTSSETIHLPTMENTLNLCYSVFQLLGHEKQVHEYVPYVATSAPYHRGANKAYSSSWSKTFQPMDNGWKGQDILFTDEKGVERKQYKYVKLDEEGNVLAGPCWWSDCEQAELHYQSKVADTKRKEEEKEKREMKAVIQQWIDEDGTWVLDKRQPKGKIWVKELLDEQDGIYYEVAYAAKILDIPYSEGEFRREFGKDLLEGAITVAQVYELLQEMQAERQALEELEDARAQQQQLRLDMGGGSERGPFNGYADDDDDYGFADYVANKYSKDAEPEPYAYKKLTCPHCKSIAERLIGRWGCKGDEFFCDDCSEYSDEQLDGTFAKPVDIAPIHYGANVMALSKD